MVLIHKLKRAMSLPPHVVAQKIWNRVRLAYGNMLARRRTRHEPTYFSHKQIIAKLSQHYSLPIAPAVLEANANTLRLACENHLAHRFNLLGSGWVQVQHGMDCAGVEGHRYAAATGKLSKRLWQRLNASNRREAKATRNLIAADYEPIDWHIDFKSGWRWREDTWYRDIQYGSQLGVDVKVPWELSRMQHLPQLGLYFALLHRRNDSRAGQALNEFRNQVLDFIAANPPRFGVNWTCTMDVAIRASNWLLAFDLFRGAGGRFDTGFLAEFRRSIHQHGRHIVENLEWNENLRANHYLADIAGLVFVASHLEGEEPDDWLLFAAHQWLREIKLQFHPDGSNFEASTCYHRLSGEMAAYATAVLLGLPESRKQQMRQRAAQWEEVRSFGPVRVRAEEVQNLFDRPDWFAARIEGMAGFSCHLTQSDGRVPQFGDNDNGRFIKLIPEWPAREKLSVAPEEEESLCQQNLVAALNGLLQEPALQKFTGDQRPETEVVRALAKGKRLNTKTAQRAAGLITAGVNPAARRGIAYSDFGLYQLQNDIFSLWVRCGSVGQNGNGGHAHNDQLSFTLTVFGVPLLVDPGTGVYTPLHHRRNAFRSSRSHNTLSLESDPLDTFTHDRNGLFRMSEKEEVAVRQFDPDAFCGTRQIRGICHTRTLKLASNVLHGKDECTAEGQKLICFHLPPEVTARPVPDIPEKVLFARSGAIFASLQAGAEIVVIKDSLYSPCYGRMVASHCVEICFRGAVCSWEIRACSEEPLAA